MLSSKELGELSKTPAFHAEMKTIFFEAMNVGYATDAPKKQSILWLPNNQTIEYKRGQWRVVDTYHVTQLGPRSGGTTLIAYEETPIWMMQYFGEYEKEAIQCLKAALRTAYENKQFFGGRGPESFQCGEYVYTNSSPRNVWRNHNFGDRFNGEEEICDSRARLYGWHTYQGGGML